MSARLKVLSAFSTATVTALAPEKGLRLLSAGCWASPGVATFGGLAGAALGLTGVVYGICIGWIARWLIPAWICVPHLRHSTDATSRV
jgi:Na+(H+)/acetate symporter ActP